MYTIMGHAFTVRNPVMMIFTLAFLVTAIVGLHSYIQPFGINTVLGVIAIFTSGRIQRMGDRRGVFMWVAATLGMLYIFVPAKTLLFFAIASAIFYVVEVFSGRVNHAPVFCVVLMSPIAEYGANLFSFPVRLHLTSLAGAALRVMDPPTRVEGNVIISGASEYSVDPACMGLYMFISSMLACLILLGIHQKRCNRELTAMGVIACLVCVGMLNVVSNLVRIIFLVWFDILPGTVFHELAGLVCFVVYVITPLMYILPRIIMKRGKLKVSAETVVRKPLGARHIVFNAGLLLLFISGVAEGRGKSANDGTPAAFVNAAGYETSLLPDRITKLENEISLVYVKPIAGFYASDHQPMVCWGGSGYEFSKVEERAIGNHVVYCAVLQKENDKLYTSWWYESKTGITISQLNWRWNSLWLNEPCALVNVTTADPESLVAETKKLIAMKVFGSMTSLHTRR